MEKNKKLHKKTKSNTIEIDLIKVILGSDTQDVRTMCRMTYN